MMKYLYKTKIPGQWIITSVIAMIFIMFVIIVKQQVTLSPEEHKMFNAEVHRQIHINVKRTVHVITASE